MKVWVGISLAATVLIGGLLFVLFLVVAPLGASSGDIELPKTSEIPAADEAFTIRVTGAGDVVMAGDTISSDAFAAALTGHLGDDFERQIYIKASEEAPYSDVLDTVASINRLGFTKVAFITEPNRAEVN